MRLFERKVMENSLVVQESIDNILDRDINHLSNLLSFFKPLTFDLGF